MTRPTRLLALILLLSAMTAWAQPAQAARLASVTGQAGGSEVRESADFRLSEQSVVQVNYNATKREKNCAVQVRVYREQNGRWLVVNTVLRTSDSSSGSKRLTLPPGRYRIQVIATQASFDISVDN